MACGPASRLPSGAEHVGTAEHPGAVTAPEHRAPSTARARAPPPATDPSTEQPVPSTDRQPVRCAGPARASLPPPTSPGGPSAPPGARLRPWHPPPEPRKGSRGPLGARHPVSWPVAVSPAPCHAGRQRKSTPGPSGLRPSVPARLRLAGWLAPSVSGHLALPFAHSLYRSGTRPTRPCAALSLVRPSAVRCPGVAPVPRIPRRSVHIPLSPDRRASRAGDGNRTRMTSLEGWDSRH